MKRFAPFSLIARKSSRCRAFSLVEMLTVMAVMAILVAVSITSLAGNSQSRRLSTAGNLITDLANQARQNSISHNVLTALVAVYKSNNSDWDGRLFILMQLGPNDTAWTPITKWQKVPTGIVIDPTQSGSFLASPTLPTSISSLNGLTYMATPLASNTLAFQIFMPDGRLLTNTTTASSSPLLYLVPGTLQGSKIVYQDAGGAAGNYYEITINPYTGTSIVDRP